MTLKEFITTRYGAGIHKRVSNLSSLKKKLAATKNHVIFLERCKANRVIPTYLQSRCPIKTPQAKRLRCKYQLALLRETLRQERKKWHRLSYNIRRETDWLQHRLAPVFFPTVQRLSNATYEREFSKQKRKLRNKFSKLTETHKPTHPKRPSLITNPLLQLQTNGPLPPEAVSLLSLGPKFCVTPKEIPKMEIMNEVEKCAQTLERKGKTLEAQTLRHETAEILKKAKKPKSNLTAEQKKGLTYLKKKDNLAVTPFDKGQGFVVIEKEKLVEKSEKEFQNVTLDTPDTTDSLERKLQNKLRELKKENKFDENTYKEIYPSGSTTPSANPAIKAHKPTKDYPARLITSHINAPQENLASLLNNILKPFIQANPLICKNSFEFVQKAKTI